MGDLVDQARHWQVMSRHLEAAGGYLSELARRVDFDVETLLDSFAGPAAHRFGELYRSQHGAMALLIRAAYVEADQWAVAAARASSGLVGGFGSGGLGRQSIGPRLRDFGESFDSAMADPGVLEWFGCTIFRLRTQVDGIVGDLAAQRRRNWPGGVVSAVPAAAVAFGDRAAEVESYVNNVALNVRGADIFGLDVISSVSRAEFGKRRQDLDPYLAGLRAAAMGDRAWNDDDVAAFEEMAFVDFPEQALVYVMQLGGVQDDLNGQSQGIPITVISDAALMAMANSALSAATTWTERVEVVGRLPETTSGLRNRLITVHYAEMADAMNRLLNPPGRVDDPGDPSSLGHTGANWAHFGASASHGVGPVIDGSIDMPFGFPEPSMATRQQTADGNQWIFGTIAPAYASVLDGLDPGDRVTKDFALRNLSRRRTDYGRDLFVDGTEELRDGMAFYLAAIDEDDPLLRQSKVFTGSTLLGSFEQGGINSYLQDIWEVSRSDDGVVAWLAEPFVAVFGGGEQAIATSLASVKLGLDGEEFELTKNIADRDDPNNLVDDLSFDMLDPTSDRTQVITFDGFTVGRNAADADIVLQDMHGVGDRPEASGLPDFPLSPAVWEEHGGNEWLATPGLVQYESQSGRDGDITGTGAIDWSEPESRMWFIANWFRELHSSPDLFESINDFDRGVIVPWLDEGA